MPVIESTIKRVRKSGPNPALKTSGWWGWPWWSSQSLNTPTVTDESALSLTAFYRGVSLISSTIAGLPFHVHRDNDDGTKEVLRTEETRYLWGRPNVEMTRQSMWERVVADEVRGNAFIFVMKTPEGTPESIWWISRRRVKVGRASDGRKVYEVDNEIPMIDYKEGGEIVHIPNWGDGIVGYDIVQLAAQSLALGLSAEEYASRTFSQGQVPPGIITSDMELTPEQSDALAARWRRLHSGVRKSQEIAVLGNGAKFQQTSVDPEKMQLEAVRRFQASEIATLLGLPPDKLSIVDRSTSWGSGIAEQGQAMITYTLMAHIRRVEQAIDDALLVRELTDRYIKLDLGGLLRGTTLQRYQAHALGYARWQTVNEIRADEDLPPIEGGDVVLAQLNQVPLEELTAISNLGTGAARPAEGGEE